MCVLVVAMLFQSYMVWNLWLERMTGFAIVWLVRSCRLFSHGGEWYFDILESWCWIPHAWPDSNEVPTWQWRSQSNWECVEQVEKGFGHQGFCIILKEFAVKGVVKSRTKQQKFMSKLSTADFNFFLVVIDKTYDNFWAQLFALPWLGAKRNWDFFCLFFLVV